MRFKKYNLYYNTLVILHIFQIAYYIYINSGKINDSKKIKDELIIK